LHHCPSGCHVHAVQDFPGVSSGSFTAQDHEYPSHLELKLTATDSGGLQGTTSVLLYPQTVALTLASSPTGLQLVFNATTSAAPLSRTVIVGSRNSIGAPSPQTLGGVRYEYRSWSDGLAQSHNVTAGGSPTTYTATYAATSADMSVVKTGAPSADRKRITFSLAVSNKGPASAASVLVKDVLPSRTSYLSSTTTKGSCAYSSATRTVSCALGSMVNAEAATVNITVQIDKHAEYVTNTGTVSSSSPDLNTGNNSSTIRLRVR
jgi:uncharacterized repeat protein (TIGR01451 family)